MNLYLIDGNSYVYRAYFAIRGLTNTKGFPTNAIYGFTTMLIKIIREKKPDRIAVLFDTAEPTERHALFEGYKAQRPEMPSDLSLQLPHIRRMVSALQIRVLEVPGYEADDLIGTIAKRAAAGGDEVFIVTADKDMLQLVGDSVRVYDPMKDRILDAEYVRERFGVGPERVPEFMGLVGDSVDNIPGVKGVGEKTARELLSCSESLEDLFSHPERIRKEKLRAVILENRETAFLSRQLALIDTAVPIDFETSDFEVLEPDWRALLALFKEFEFTSLMKLIPAAPPSGCKYEIVSDPQRLSEVVGMCTGAVAIEVLAQGRYTAVGLSIAFGPDMAYYIPLSPTESGIEKATALGIFEPLFTDAAITKIGHDLKTALTALQRERIPMRGAVCDTMIAASLLNPNRASHSLEEVTLEHLSSKTPSCIEITGKKAGVANLPEGVAASFCSSRAGLAFALSGTLFPALKERGLARAYFDVEMPLVPVLSDMEAAGVKIDVPLLGTFSRELCDEIASIEKRVHFMAGEEFNINSPKQLSRILFQNLGLNPGRKTKTGYSTDMEVLEELAAFHDLPREVLSYRSLTKLKTTYLDVLPGLVDPATGRVHTIFHQEGTATGRLSSSDPNLQNIPIRGEWGRKIRHAFVAEEGNVLISADYSQIELRVLAHLSGDPHLAESFHSGVDIHTRTASEIYGVPQDAVTHEMRRTAKMVNFGIIYGISPFGLSEALNIGRDTAKQYIDRYFGSHPGVRAYIEETLASATDKGFVSTLFGRQRDIPELRSTNKTTRLLGERLAVNTPVQGTAAEIVKIAMIKLSHALAPMKARMILQVHDELLFELPEDQAIEVSGLVREAMENAVPLSVPLRIEMGAGRNWAEAHGSA